MEEKYPSIRMGWLHTIPSFTILIARPCIFPKQYLGICLAWKRMLTLNTYKNHFYGHAPKPMSEQFNVTTEKCSSVILWMYHNSIYCNCLRVYLLHPKCSETVPLFSVECAKSLKKLLKKPSKFLTWGKFSASYKSTVWNKSNLFTPRSSQTARKLPIFSIYRVKTNIVNIMNLDTIYPIQKWVSAPYGYCRFLMREFIPTILKGIFPSLILVIDPGFNAFARLNNIKRFY